VTDADTLIVAVNEAPTASDLEEEAVEAGAEVPTEGESESE
jgi:large subunit ribosomal protein L25